MDLTHVTASVVGGQQYSRPGHSCRHISWPNETERVCSNEATLTTISRINIKLKQKYALWSKGSLKKYNLHKNIIPEECTQGKFR